MPTLLLGVAITLTAVVSYSWYITGQMSRVRRLQTDLVDRNRKDSLQLLRIQDDLNTLALAMRDMLDETEPYPLTAWSAQFRRVRADLDDAFAREQQVAAVIRVPEQRRYLQSSMAQFWDAADHTFGLAQSGKSSEAREQIRLSLQSHQQALSNAVARLLIQNNEAEEEATRRITEIYDGLERQVYLFLTATLAAVVLTSVYLVRSNRRLFAQIATLSEQRSELAQKLIAMQESTLRHLSRELHDEFGQILTAVGSMLARAGRHVQSDSPLYTELRDVSETAQSALDSVRTLSQALHPVILDEGGLESALDWYLPTVERQTGIAIAYEKTGTPFVIPSGSAIHVYRVIQEALNNVARHSGANKAWVRLKFSPDRLELEIEDHGKGFAPGSPGRGIGLVGMQERAQLLHATLQFATPAGGGTLVRLTVPKDQLDVQAGEDQSSAG